MHLRHRLALAALTVWGALGPALAQDVAPDEVAMDLPANLVLAAAPGDAALPSPAGQRLVGALEAALRADPDLRVARFAPRVARAQDQRARSEWDALFTSDLSLKDDEQPAASGLDGAAKREAKSRAASVGVVKPLESGGSVSATLSDRRDETNSSFALFNPVFRSGLGVSLKKPLARGAGPDAARRGVRLAGVALRKSDQELRKLVLGTVAETERAYWNLAAAAERREVARLSLAQAESLLTASRARVKAGALAPISVVEAEAAVAQRQGDLLASERTLGDAADAFMRRTDPPPRPGAPIPALADPPGRALPAAPDPVATYARALAAHPELESAKLDLEADRIELAFARDGFLPKLDMLASLDANGLGRKRGDAWDQTSGVDNPTWFVGLSVEVPMGRRGARAESDRRRLEVEQSLAGLQALELRIEGDVNAAIRRYATDVAQIEIADRAVNAAKAKLDAEEERFREGLITADDLLRFQRELAETRSSEVSARAQASISAMEIERVAGTLPEARGIALGAGVQ